MGAPKSASGPRWGLRIALGLLALFVLVLGIAGGTLVWLLRSESGTAFVASRMPGLQTEGLRGALLSDTLGADHLRWQGDAGTLEIDALELTGMRWSWRPSSRAWIGLHGVVLSAARVAWRSGEAPPSDAPPALPTHLDLPAEVQLALRVSTLQIDDLAPVRDLAFELHAGADTGATHRLDALSLRWDQLTASGELRLAASAPFALEGALALATVAEAPLPWEAAVRVAGDLAKLALTADLKGEGRAGRPGPVLTLNASLAPFERWPLAALTAHTDALDLSALASGLPQTRLKGRAVLHSQALDRPMQAELSLDNALPGRWDEGRLPLRTMQLAIEATPTSPDQVDIDRFDLRLGDASANAGRWTGQGRWTGHRLTLDTRLDDLAVQRLDGRAAPMTIGGPVNITIDRLPSPDPAAPVPKGSPEIGVEAKLEGRLSEAPHAVTMDLSVRAGDGVLRVEQLLARAGAASAELKAEALRSAAGWAVSSQGRLVDFDPLPWWQGPTGSNWRRGPHRLNGDWSVALTVPRSATTLPPLEMLQRLAGQGRIAIDRSMLAGVPLAARVDAAQDGGTRVQAALQAGDNRLALDGRLQALGDGSGDRWQLEVDAPKLAALAPIARLIPPAADWAPRDGQLNVRAQASGRWPAMTTEGDLTLQALRSGPLAVDRGHARWNAATRADAPMTLQVDIDQLAFGEQQVPTLRAAVSGTLRQHRVQVQATLPVQPPPAVAQSLSLSTGRGTRLSLQADGDWTPGPETSRWSARIVQLAAGVWDGKPPAAGAAPATDWLDARDLRAQIDFDRAGSLRRLHADAGRLTLAGGIALRWDDVVYAPQAGRPELQLKAEIETFAVAPLLARWQPTLGWDGDLQVGARIDLRAGERFDADVVIERERGDLMLRDGSDTPLALGLTDLRLGLSAHDGTWLFTQGLAGRTLGELGGLLRIRARPQDLWPQASAPIDGSALLRVANLAIWGAWVPPGWRLAGSLQTSGSFAGTFGAPQVTGELRGENLGVRNLLLGVHVTDGQVAMKLEGERATIEHFTLRGGDGQLTLTGGADLGAAPRARLSLNADRFQVLGRIDRRLVASGQADLALDAQALDLGGNFKIDEGLFDASRADAPALDGDVVVRRPGAPPPEQKEAPDAQSRRAIKVALAVDLGDQLVVRGRGLNTRLAGQLRITAPGGRLAVNGTVNTVGGSYAAYGQQMTIERGLVAFSGPVDSPRLDVLALRPKLDVEVGVAITGTAQSPRVRLYSNPEMSDTDKLSWLVLGKAPDALGRTDTALLQRAAIALLSGEEAGPTDALVRKLGLDDISVRQSETGGVTDTVLTLGKQISDRWYVGYERGVNATTGTWQLIYRVAQRFTLRAQSGEEDAIDLIWTWRVK